MSIAKKFKNYLILSLIRWSPGFGIYIRSFENRLGNVKRALELDFDLLTRFREKYWEKPYPELLQSMNTAGQYTRLACYE